jgi:hypothetical protein
MGQPLKVVGGRLNGGFTEDGFALDDVARGDRQHVLADQFMEALARLVLDDGGFGELTGSPHEVHPRSQCSRPTNADSGNASLRC